MSKTMHTTRRVKQRERGFTLLLAALVSSIVLALGASIFAIAQKEVQLSSIGRDSQFAFYAADTAAECALYWDFRDSYFASSTPQAITPKCDGKAMGPFTVTPTQAQPYQYPYTMTSAQMDLFSGIPKSNPYCAQVSITKTYDATTNSVRTVVHANGYSTPCASLTVNTDALQRSVELSY